MAARDVPQVVVALPLSLKIALAVICTLLGHRVATRLHLDHRAGLDNALRHAPWLALLGLSTAVLGGAAWVLTLRPDYTWSLPLWLQYWATAINWSVVLATLCFLFATTLSLARRTRDARGWPLLVIAVATLGGLEWYQLSLLAPPNLGAKETTDGVVLQTSGRSCGAASAANVARCFGFHATEAEMARRLGTSAGTSAAQVIYGLEELGIHGTPTTIPPSQLASLRPPAILFLEARGPLSVGHIVAYLGRSEAAFVILDPLQGRVMWRADQMPHGWNGRAIEFEQRAP